MPRGIRCTNPTHDNVGTPRCWTCQKMKAAESYQRKQDAFKLYKLLLSQ